MHEGCKYCAIVGHFLLHTVFLRLDTMATIRHHGYYFLSLLVILRLLFEDSVYFCRKLTDIIDGWIRYMYERYSDDY